MKDILYWAGVQKDMQAFSHKAKVRIARLLDMLAEGLELQPKVKNDIKIYYAIGKEKKMSSPKFVKSTGNVFKDVGFDEIEAKSLKFRSHLMTILMRYIEYKKLTQKEAAKRLNVTQPRISNLIHGKIDLFSIGMLLDMMERAGFSIYEKIEIDARHLSMEHEQHQKQSVMGRSYCRSAGH